MPLPANGVKTALLALLVSIGCPSLASATAAVEAEAGPDVVGQAYDLDSGDLLYSEHYFCSEDQLECRVLYRDDGGELIARKQIDYRANQRSPALFIEDFRQASELRLDTSVDPEVVVDAGFDNYVRQRWEELEAGQSIRFPFLVLGRDSPLDMKASSVDEAQCDVRQLCLQIRLDSWLLGAFVDPIELTYDRETRRLMRFRGLSNLRDAQGKSQYVDIRYSYSQPVQLGALTAP